MTRHYMGRFWIAFVGSVLLSSLAWSAPAKAKPAAKTTVAKPAASKPAAKAATPAAAPATADTSSNSTAPAKANAKDGEMDVTIKGSSKEKMVVGKLDPPAAFNLEDIQNFPEDRLQPVLNNPITFEEGKDFSVLMNFKNEQMVHPWLPELSKAPFLQMRSNERSAREWAFSIIDQSGATIAKQQGKGDTPAELTWAGSDSERDYVAVDTVYIPQLLTVDKDGYHRTLMGQPVQFASLQYKDGNRNVIELSTKKLFLENKTEWSKEAPFLLEKVCDALREDGRTTLTVQIYQEDSALGQGRQKAFADFLSSELFIPRAQISLNPVANPAKRGTAIAIILG